MQIKFILLTLACLLGGSGLSLANQVIVKNPDLKALNNGLAKVRFDLSWENSWRDADNYDACWVFVKYSTNAGVTWNHATLAGSGTNPVNYSAGTGTGLDVIVPSRRFPKRICGVLSDENGDLSKTILRFPQHPHGSPAVRPAGRPV